jgi:hypothetical protein
MEKSMWELPESLTRGESAAKEREWAHGIVTAPAGATRGQRPAAGLFVSLIIALLLSFL